MDDYDGYNRNRNNKPVGGGGGRNERVIPISFGDGRQPNPHQPYHPPPPTRPERHPDNKYSGNSKTSLPVQPTSEKQNSDFSEHELDEMDAVMEMLKQKREAEGKQNDHASRSSSSSYRFKSETNVINQSVNNEVVESENTDYNISYPDQNDTHFHPQDPNNSVPGNISQQTQIGFVMPMPVPNTPYSQNVHNLPYPSNPNPQFLDGTHGPGYPSQPNLNEYPNSPSQHYGNNPSFSYGNPVGIPQPYQSNSFQQSYYPTNPNP